MRRNQNSLILLIGVPHSTSTLGYILVVFIKLSLQLPHDSLITVLGVYPREINANGQSQKLSMAVLVLKPKPKATKCISVWESVQFSSVAQSCPTLHNPMNRSTPGLPVHHHFLEFTQTHVHRVSDAIQPSHPRSSPSPPAPNPSQHQSLFQWVTS